MEGAFNQLGRIRNPFKNAASLDVFYKKYLLCSSLLGDTMFFGYIYIRIQFLRYENPICSYSSMFHYVLFGDPLFEIFLQTWQSRSRWCISSRLTMAFRRTIAAGNRYKDQTPRVQIVNPFCLAETTQIRYNKKDYTEYILAMPYIWPWEKEDHT